MRTSRGLRITSLIVVSPVILILISLVVILAMAIQSQVKQWYFAISSTQQPLYMNEQVTSLQPHPQFIHARSISRLASTAFVFSYNQQQLSTSLVDYQKNNSNRIDNAKLLPTTTTRRLLPRLKRLLPSSTWIGVLTLFAFITFQKVPFQQPLKSIASCIHPTDQHRDETTIVQNKSHGKRRKKTKRSVTTTTNKSSASAAQTTTNTTTTTEHSTPDPTLYTDGATVITPVQPCLQEEDLSLVSIVESSDNENHHHWINVTDKKKKRLSSIKEETAAIFDHTITATTDATTTSNSDPMSCATTEASLDEDDDDITTDDDDVESISVKTPPSSSSNTPKQPRIQSWYSPFSTGLDLDIMPKGSDLVLNQPLGPRMNGDLFFRHHQLDQWKTNTLNRRQVEPFTYFNHYPY